jgi:hypothetical protein
MKRLALLFILVTAAPVSAYATEGVERAKFKDKQEFDALLKGMAGDFNPQPAAIDPALKQRVNRAQERQNQRKSNTREQNRRSEERTRQSPNVSTPTPQRTR